MIGTMTVRERVLAALRGQPVDYLPWVPRWDLFFYAAQKDGRLPDKYRGWDMIDVSWDLGVGFRSPAHPSIPGTPNAFRKRLRNVEVVRQERGDLTITEYRTRFGTVSTVFEDTPLLRAQAVRGREMEHMLKRVEDYDAIQFIVENTEIVPTYEEYAAYQERIGERGVATASAGGPPLEEFWENYTGDTEAFYELADHPNQVERLFQALEAKGKEIQKVVADSPAEIVNYAGINRHISTPRLYPEYFLPYCQECTSAMHGKGKICMTHAHDEIRGLPGLLLEAGFDAIDVFPPAPLTSLTIAEVKQAFAGKMSIWGGLPSTMLQDSIPFDEFHAYVMQLLKEIAPGDRFVLGSGDNFPTDSSFERLAHITELVEKYGRYPMSF